MMKQIGTKRHDLKECAGRVVYLVKLKSPLTVYRSNQRQISQMRLFNPTRSRCIRMRDAFGTILFDLRRLFGSGKNSINKVCMTYDTCAFYGRA